MKKIISVLTALVFALTFGTVFAQEQKSGETGGTATTKSETTKEQKKTKKKKKTHKKKSAEGAGTGGMKSKGTGTTKGGTK